MEVNRKILSVFVLGVLLVGCASAYYCIDTSNDNGAVIEFKNKINVMAIKEDIKQHDLTEDAFYLKLKYFGPCDINE